MYSTRCIATAVIKNPDVTDDKPLPKYMELNFDKIYLPYSSTKRKVKYSCRICKRSIMSVMESTLFAHR